MATASVTGTAGCGYAYGGGDVREVASFPTLEFANQALVALDSDRVVYGTSGRQIVWGSDETGFADVTELSCWSRDGELRWSHTHDVPSRSIAAAGETVYVLDLNDSVVAIEATEVESRTETDDEYETETRWSVAVTGARPSLAADEMGAYLARGGGLLAVREGSVAWNLDLPETPETLVAVEGGVVASLPGAAVAVAADGSDRWRIDTNGVSTVAAASGRTAVHDGDRLRVRRSLDGAESWSVDIGGPGRPAVTAETVYVTEYGRVRAFDAASGAERWASEPTAGISPPLIPAPKGEGVYTASAADCMAVAVDADGERWRRRLDIEGGCRATAGWLDGETVAFLFESGAVRWLQRTDQPAPGSV